MKTYIGIDNGCSGSIGIISADGEVQFGMTPNKMEQNYTKKEARVTRIDAPELHRILAAEKEKSKGNLIVVMERPFVNPKMFMASLSAIRALEATLNILELLEIPYRYIDSKEWQKALLPGPPKGTAALKLASLQIGRRLFPQIKNADKDYDGLLIAEHCRRENY